MSGFDRIISEQTIRTERERVNIAKEEQNRLAQENGNLELELIKTKKELEKARSELARHESSPDTSSVAIIASSVALEAAIPILRKNIEEELLSKPMYELAARNKNFAEAYRLQQEMLANWMVSQKAFKELAIRFGKEKGMTKDEVIDQGMDLKEDVLNDANDPSHNTNASQASFISPFISALKTREYDQILAAVNTQRLYGLDLAPNSTWRKAFRTWLKLAEQGSAQAQHNVGRCYTRGEGVGKDTAQAYLWYMRAVQQNDPRACYNLSLLFNDEGFDMRDPAKVAEYFEKAVALGESRALADAEERAAAREEEQRQLQAAQEEEQRQLEAARKQREAQEEAALKKNIEENLKAHNPAVRALAQEALDKNHAWASAAVVAANLQISDEIDTVVIASDLLFKLKRNKTHRFSKGDLSNLLSATLEFSNPSPCACRISIPGLSAAGVIQPGEKLTLNITNPKWTPLAIETIHVGEGDDSVFSISLPAPIKLLGKEK